MFLRFFSFCLLFLTATLSAQPDDVKRDQVWEEIAPFFSPPPALSDTFGDYRSPLKFYDGRIVRKRKEWKARRSEIVNQWHALMGKWPPLLTQQKLTVLDTVRKEGYDQHRVRFRWTPDEFTEGYLLIPHGKSGKRPAMITVFYEPESAIGEGREHRDFARQLVLRGFIALSIGTTAATEARTYSLYYPHLDSAVVQPLSMLAYAAANAWHVLAKVQGVDDKRIGIMGHSFGGKWALFASCLYEKFACGVWSDPGIVFDETRADINYWEPWYLGYHPRPWRARGLITETNPARGLYPYLVSEGYDLHELHALMAPRPFLVSGGAEDPPSRWVALNHSRAVNRLLGYENRVAMTNRAEHSPNDTSNEQAMLFLEYFLKYRGK